MTAPPPWLVRTDSRARRIGSSVSIESLAVPAGSGVDGRALGEWHVRVLAERYAGLSIGELEPVELGGGGALMRYGKFSAPEGRHILAVYRVMRGTVEALVAEGPATDPADLLSQALLEWIEHEGTVSLTVEEFRAIERLSAVPPIAFVPRSRLVETADDAPGGVIDVIARSLALRGLLQQDGDGGWALTAGAGAVVEPLIGSKHIAWLTWSGAQGDRGSAAIGRASGPWSLLRAGGGGLRATALDATAPANTTAALGGVSAETIAGRGVAVAATASALRPGNDVKGLGSVAAVAAARFLRPADGALEQMELSWLHDDNGGLWEVSTGSSGVLTATPIGGSSLIARLSEGFESGGASS